MSRKMLINATHPEEHRVAIVEDGFLTELDIEITGKEQTRGNIYKALVVRVESGLQAAFVDYGAERLGFLQIGEIHPALLPKSDSNGRSRARINEILRPGQEILVQVLKEERGTKGAALTTFLSLPGRFMVLMPESPTKGVSRKIEEESERKKLKKAMAELDLPENMGYIVRTAGIGKAPEELRRDFDNLVKVYRGIEERSRQLKAPSLVFRESNLIIRCIRDYFTEDTEEVLVDDPTVFEEAREFFRMLMPDKLRLVKLHQERRPIFSRYQIEEQIETMAHNKVPLPSGGSIVLDATEALVAIDVNSGKMAGEQGIEATASKTNLEAAVEIARQLRLRDLAGLIVIDFIDMRDRKHIKAVEKTLRDALQKDKSRVTVGRISQFGLLEMSRQRLKPMLAAASYLECPHCQGRGRIKSPEAQGVAFLRRIQTAVAKGQIRQAEGFVPLDVADFLLNHKREELVAMEQKYDLKIVLHGRAGLLPHQSDLNLVRREKEDEARDRMDLPSLEPSGLLEPAAIMDQTTIAAEAGEEPPPPSSPETDAEEKSGKKKRRRRRRKKSGGGEAPETGAEKETAGEEEEPEASTPSVEESAVAAAAVEESAPATPKAKKKSRSRRRKKTESPNGATTTATDIALAPAMNGEPAPLPVPPPEETPVAAAPPAEETKGPSRARRGRAKKASESTGVGEPSAAATPAESALETAKPKTARARKPAAKPLAEGPDTEAAEPAKPPKARATPRKKAKPRPKAAEAEGAPVAEKSES